METRTKRLCSVIKTAWWNLLFLTLQLHWEKFVTHLPTAYSTAYISLFPTGQEYPLWFFSRKERSSSAWESLVSVLAFKIPIFRLNLSGALSTAWLPPLSETIRGCRRSQDIMDHAGLRASVFLPFCVLQKLQHLVMSLLALLTFLWLCFRGYFLSFYPIKDYPQGRGDMLSFSADQTHRDAKSVTGHCDHFIGFDTYVGDFFLQTCSDYC